MNLWLHYGKSRRFFYYVLCIVFMTAEQFVYQNNDSVLLPFESYFIKKEMVMIETRFKKKSQIVDIGITTVCAVLSVGTMLYAINKFGLGEAWPELVLNLFYIACLVLMAMYFFKRLDGQRFNYWSSVCIGITVLLRDILFPPPLESFPIHLVCLTLSVLLLLMLTFFYARKDWESYTKRDLWMICIIDMVIAGLYNYVIYHNPVNEYTSYLLTEIWIRPTLTYGLVACFISEKEAQVK